MAHRTKTTLPNDLVIAHRGTTYWAPEETEAAMRWARNIGADYLELDLQRTKDGYLIALHDEVLTRTTDIAKKFPDRINDPVSTFTYLELLQLDAGSWFNHDVPERAMTGFAGLDILTLQDVIMIAEGMRIKRDASGKRILIENGDGTVATAYEKDPMDNGNRPGIYVETKVPELFPDIEHDLKKALERAGWYSDNASEMKHMAVEPGKVSVAATDQRVILQTFSRQSLMKLDQLFQTHVPLCYLLWRGEGPDDIQDDSYVSYREAVGFAKANGASIIGPSISGAPNNYSDLLSADHFAIIRANDMAVHAYSFDTWEQMLRYYGFTKKQERQAEPARVDGIFTNRADEALIFMKEKRGSEREALIDPRQLLLELGYGKTTGMLADGQGK